ncbi:MAG: hypothetical protein IPO78_13440 [Saprospiraceae bacterium]|nr:hypothetical protein [Saprospiraceae bacterium]
MKFIIAIITIFGLLIITFYQYHKLNELTLGNIFLRDTIDQFRIQNSDREEQQFYFLNLEDLIQESYSTITTDSVYEIHWFKVRHGLKFHFIKIECKIDSSHKLTHKIIRLKNQITGEGKDTLLKTNLQYLSKMAWQEFKNKLNQINFYNIADYNGMSTGFETHISWESVGSGKRYKYNELAHKGKEFMEACDYLFQQINGFKY